MIKGYEVTKMGRNAYVKELHGSGQWFFKGEAETIIPLIERFNQDLFADGEFPDEELIKEQREALDFMAGVVDKGEIDELVRLGEIG